MLNSARQKGETVQECVHRVRVLAQNMPKVSDPASVKMHHEYIERMIVASYTSGLAGTPDIQVRFRLPSTLEEVVRIALVDQQAEFQERKRDAFFLNKDRQSSDAGSSSR
jgi:hypothetical protein